MWKPLSTFLIVFFFLNQASAQFGINGSYRLNQMPDLSGLSPDRPEFQESLLGNGFSFGVDYWFRMKNIRIEFLPEANYGKYERTFSDNSNLEAQFISFFFNTNFYLFDLSGDCDCPTFSKQGPTLSKGFYVQISPGISLIDTFYDLPDESAKDWVVNLGAGVGVDIGLSDYITLTPMAGVRLFPNAKIAGIYLKEDPNAGPQTLDNHYDILQWHAGLRLGFRFDN